MKINKKVLLITILLSFVSFESAFAAAPTLVTGTQQLFSDALGWVLILVPIAAALAIAFCKLKQMLSDNDPAEIAKYNKMMKGIIIAAIIAESASGLIAAVLAYY